VVVGYEIDSAGNAKKVWVHKHMPQMHSDEDHQNKQPTKEQKCMAAVCRYVTGLIDAKIKRGGDENRAVDGHPYSGISAERLLMFFVLTGSRYAHEFADTARWTEIMGMTDRNLQDAVWTMSAPVLIRRIKYATVSDCKPQYDEAVRVAYYVFGIEQKKLDEIS
jgi:hypothetical protein